MSFPFFMPPDTTQLDTGMDLRDLLADEDFRRREHKPRDANRESVALRRLSRLLAEAPETILQDLVDTAVELCGADSAGISLEEPERGTFRWVVIAGSFGQYLDGRTPRNYSPCGTCLDSGRPQLYRVTQPYYDHLGVTAEPILDGMLIPWSNEFLCGTLWAVSHSSSESFSTEDYALLSSLSDFASIILRHQHQQALLRAGERARATDEMAHKLAHRINNPLQSLTNTLFLARHGSENIQEYLAQAETDLASLSQQVATLLNTSIGFKPADLNFAAHVVE
jgi:two-component sensor histidine kinase